MCILDLIVPLTSTLPPPQHSESTRARVVLIRRVLVVMQPDAFDRAAIRQYQSALFGHVRHPPRVDPRRIVPHHHVHAVVASSPEFDFSDDVDQQPVGIPSMKLPRAATTTTTTTARYDSAPAPPVPSHSYELSLTSPVGVDEVVPRETLCMLQDHVSQLGVAIRKWDAREVVGPSLTPPSPVFLLIDRTAVTVSRSLHQPRMLDTASLPCFDILSPRPPPPPP